MLLKKIMTSSLIVFLCFLALRVNFVEDVGGAEIRVPQDYPSIQEAVNGANAGDTILVAPSVYRENVVVDKPLRIIGESAVTTVVDGGGYDWDNMTKGFLVVSSNVSIENFTVRNSFYGINVENVENISIQYNVLTLNLDGIRLNGTHRATIQNSIAVNNTFGIYIYNSSNCSIEKNRVDNNYGGHPDLRIGGGIELDMSNDTTVTNNCLTRNLMGILLEQSYRNTIVQNVVANGSEAVYFGGSGIGLYSQSNYNLVINNTCYSNPEGITLGSSHNNTVRKNIVFDNWGCGIGMMLSTGNTYERNLVFNQSVGMTMEKTSDTILGNLIFNNTSGIAIHFSNGSTFYHNVLVDNTVHAPKDVYANVNSWDNGLEGNYWSNYTGTDSDMDAIGDSPHVLDELNVDRYPLMAPINIFDAGTWNDTQQQIHIISNSTVSDFKINMTQAIIRFNATGKTPTMGFCRVTIPNIIVQDMWNNNYTLLVDGQEPLFTKNWTDYTNTYIYFTYAHSEHTVTIVPENPNMLLLFLMLATILSIFLKEKAEKLDPIQFSSP